MTTSFNWTISSLERYVSTGIVKALHWRVNAEKSGRKDYSYGVLGLPAPGETFVPFEDLTEEFVIGWLDSVEYFDKEEVEAKLEEKIDKVISLETTTEGPLPWYVEPEEEEEVPG